jgi:hypothetical protein
MGSLIDATKPIQGNATTQSVRDNFATAKAEISALQAQIANYTPDLVGSVGKPAFQNSWTNFGGASVPLGFVKDGKGWVEIEGSIAGGSTAPDVIVFTLPLDHFPAQEHTFAINNNGAFSTVRIDTAGNVSLQTSNVTRVDIIRARFKAA